MNELIERIAKSIENNDVTNLAVDFVELSANIQNLNSDFENLKQENENLKQENETTKNNLTNLNIALADTMRKISISNTENKTTGEIEPELTNFRELLNERTKI